MSFSGGVELTDRFTDTKERPFKCTKCRSTFVRRDLLLRHDRTVHAKDGGAPLQNGEGRKRSGPKTSPQQDDPPDEYNGTEGDGMHNGDLDHFDGTHDDIQAAAMLMTDFRNKAAMQHHDPDLSSHGDMSAISPTVGGSMDSIPYGPETVSLPQMEGWDTLIPQNMPVYGPMPDPMSFINPDMGPQPMGPFPQHLDPTSMAPDLGNFHVAHSVSGGMGTPGALSPFPSMLGPVSPVDYRKSPGPHQAVSITRAPQVTADDQCTRIMENIKHCDPEAQLLETLRLPTRHTINRYLTNYFDLFHHHLPFLHPASFNPTEVAPALLLSALSIGALYTFEQDNAYMLHIGSKVLTNGFLQKKENFSSRKCPLWTMQATLLNMIFASWSGDAKGLEWACSIKSLIANVSDSIYAAAALFAMSGPEIPCPHHD